MTVRRLSEGQGPGSLRPGAALAFASAAQMAVSWYDGLLTSGRPASSASSTSLSISPDGELPAGATAFVAMPYSADDLQHVYMKHIKPTLEAIGLTCFRADDLLGGGLVVPEMMQAIRRATLVVAELTGGNVNVCYEVGLAHAWGIPVIMLSQKGPDPMPFDLYGYRAICYEDTAPSLRLLRGKLTEHARHALRTAPAVSV